MDPELHEILWGSHRAQWSNCLRCKLAELRLRTDPDRKKKPTAVPLAAGCARGATPLDAPPVHAPLYVLYPCPDGPQERTSTVWGEREAGGVCTSPSHGLTEWSWEALAQAMPFPLREVAFGLAFGCRPVSFSDPRKLMKAKQEYIKACRPRWQTEVLLADPDLILVCGRHALAAVRPDLATNHPRWIGEVVPIDIPTPHGVARYEGYVTVSPEDVVQNARDDQYEVHDWKVGPEASHVDNPVRHWLWHILFAAWLAQTLRDIEAGFPPSPTWVGLLKEINSFYENRTTVASLLERRSDLFQRIESIAQAEATGQGSRLLQTTDAGEADADDGELPNMEEDEDGDEEDAG